MTRKPHSSEKSFSINQKKNKITYSWNKGWVHTSSVSDVLFMSNAES